MGDKDEEDETSPKRSTLVGWRAAKARNYMRSEAKREEFRDEMRKMAEMFEASDGGNTWRQQEDEVSMRRSQLKVLVLTTHADLEAGALAERVRTEAGRQNALTICVHTVEEATQRLQQESNIMAVFLDVHSSSLHGWSMIPVIRHHKKSKVRKAYIALAILSEEDMRTIPPDINAVLLSSPRWCRMRKLPKSGDVSSAIFRAKQAYLSATGYGTQSSPLGALEQQAPEAESENVLPMPHKQPPPLRRTSVHVVQEANISPPARVFMGLDGPNTLEVRPDYITRVHAGVGDVDLAQDRNPGMLSRVPSDRGRASGRLHEALQAAEAEALAEKEAEGGRVARDRELPKPERNIARLDCADVLLQDTSVRRDIAKDPTGVTAYLRACHELQTPPLTEMVSQATSHLLFLRFFPLGIRGGQAVGAALAENLTVRDIDLGFCDLGVKGATALAKAVTSAISVCSLDLSNNRIGREGCQALSAALSDMIATLKVNHLRLGGNTIGDKGAEALARFVARHRRLTFLDIHGSNIAWDGANAIGKALEAHRDSAGGLQYLDLSFNELGDHGARLLASGLHRNTPLMTLILSHNRIEKDGAKAIGEAIVFNQGLLLIDLSHNAIQGLGAMHLASSLKIDRTLQHLDLSHNPFSAKGVLALLDAARSQEPKRLVSMNLARTFSAEDNTKELRVIGNHTFETLETLQVYIREVKDSAEDIKLNMIVYERQLGSAQLTLAKLMSDPGHGRSQEAVDIQDGIMSLTRNMELAKTGLLKMSAVMERAQRMAKDWSHDEESIEDMPLAVRMMAVEAALKMDGTRFTLAVEEPWQRSVFLQLLERSASTLGYSLSAELTGNAWILDPSATLFPELVHPLPNIFKRKHAEKPAPAVHWHVFAKQVAAAPAPRSQASVLATEPVGHALVPASGRVTVRMRRAAPEYRHRFELDLSREADRSMLQLLIERASWYSSSEKIVDPRIEGVAVDCVMNPRWRMPPKGRLALHYHVLRLSIEPEMLRGHVALDLELPWERVLASSLYHKIRRRELRRLSVVGGWLGVRGAGEMSGEEEDPGSEADSSRGKQHGGKEEDEGEGEREKEEAELPQWEGTCLLDGKEVPLDRMIRLPKQGVLTVAVAHSREEQRLRCSMGFSIYTQLAVHRWVAEKLWRRQACPAEAGFVTEKILGMPLVDHVEYPEMIERSKLAGPWVVPEEFSQKSSRMDLIYACYGSSKYIEAKEETWDLGVPSERTEAEMCLYGDSYLSCTLISLLGSPQHNPQHRSPSKPETLVGQPVPYLLPSDHAQLACCRLPPSGIVNVEVRRLKRVVDGRDKVQAHQLQALMSSLSKESGSMPNVVQEKLRQAIRDDPSFKCLTAEQACRVYAIFHNNHTILDPEREAAAECLYANSKEQLRFLHALVASTAPHTMNDATVSGNLLATSTVTKFKATTSADNLAAETKEGGGMSRTVSGESGRVGSQPASKGKLKSPLKGAVKDTKQSPITGRLEKSLKWKDGHRGSVS